MFIRRVLSHILIASAVFFLVATYFVWVIDATFLNGKQLSNAFVTAGLQSALATTLPEKMAKAEGSLPVDPVMKAKIAQTITPLYVEAKLKQATTTVLTFVRNGQPQPTIDIKDFVLLVNDAGIQIDNEQVANFKKPVLLNESGGLDNLPKYYQKLEYAKYFGIAIFLVILCIEWFVAERGKKLRKIGRIFLHSGLWFTLFWLTVVFLPSKLIDNINKGPGADPMQAVGVAMVKTMQLLLTPQLLGAAVVCFVVAAIIYISQHGKSHLQTIKEVPTARIRSSTVAKMPTRH